LNAIETEHLVYIGLGSNIAPQHNLPNAVAQLQAAIEVEELSSVWETPAIGSAGPDFLNAVARVRTNLSLMDLKNEILCEIEANMGRVRSMDKNAPRPIDLDILIYDNDVLDSGIWDQIHLALPLAELSCCIEHPQTGETLIDVAARLSQNMNIKSRQDVNLNDR
jgi:2-amino-4-hydroxy-6-hydroxymethyldihydropteridine diphosphokinase